MILDSDSAAKPQTAISEGHFRRLAGQYFDWGLVPIPLGVGKKAASSRWKEYQTQFPPRAWINQEWAARSSRNIGIICGKVSGGLTVRDFDEADDYHRWADEHPALAARLPTVRTRRGFHVYVRPADGQTASIDLRRFGVVGELKGDHTYVVAPGSIVRFDAHGNEHEPHRYSWVVQPEYVDGKAVFPPVSLTKSGLMPLIEHSTTSTLSNHNHSQHPQRTLSSEKFTPSALSQSDQISLLVDRHPITGPNQRNGALWRLAIDCATSCKGIVDEDFAIALLDAWMDRYIHLAETQCPDVNWGEFESMLDRVGQTKNPFLSALPHLYENTPKPSWAARISRLRDTGNVDRIARLVIAADMLAEGRDFFLACRTMADLTGMMPATALAITKRLCRLGILELVEAGDRRSGGSGKANLYRLLVNDDGEIRPKPLGLEHPE